MQLAAHWNQLGAPAIGANPTSWMTKKFRTYDGMWEPSKCVEGGSGHTTVTNKKVETLFSNSV